MSLIALGLVIIAALMHALWNVVAKKAGGDSRFSLLLSLFIVALWSPVGLWLAWTAMPLWGWAQYGVILVSGLANLVYFHTLLRGYAASDLTVVYPVARGSGPLLVSLGALLWLGESMSWVGALGLLLVVAGVFLVAGGPALWAKARDVSQRRRVFAGVMWGAATGLCIAAYTLVDGYGVKVLGIDPVLIVFLGNLVRVPLLLPVTLRDRPAFIRACRSQWKQALLVAGLGTTGYLLVLYAMRLAPLSHVAPAREMSMLFAALLGGKLLGEAGQALRITGAVCIGLGVAGLALG